MAFLIVKLVNNMISVITKDNFQERLPVLVQCYLSMFAEPPFNNTSITEEYAREFFRKTFEHGLIFIDTMSDFGKIYGFRTVISIEHFKDREKFHMVPGSYYLSALWIKPSIRGRNLGSDLMRESLRIIRKTFKPTKLYVRTREENLPIQGILKKYKFTKLDTYETIINNEPLNLIVWER